MRFWLILACCLLATDVFGKVVEPKNKVEGGGSESEDDEDDEEDEPRRLVLYFDFEKVNSKKARFITDKSGYENTGNMEEGGIILKYNDAGYTCNQAARLWDQDIPLDGSLFQAKPKKAITLAAWIKSEQKIGSHSVFDTIGHSHSLGQYHFEVNNGIVRWFHRNERQQVVYETMAHSVRKDKWTHVAGTYDSKTKHAKIFINGEIRNQSMGQGVLSVDWSTHAGIGNRAKLRPFRGAIDEFRMYNYALKVDEIKALYDACKGKDSNESESGNNVPETVPSEGDKKDLTRLLAPSEAKDEADSGKSEKKGEKESEDKQSVLKR